jgi:proliferating cell nuclear antigen
MTDENAHAETDASPATTQPDQPAKNAPAQETNEQMDGSPETEDSGLSSVMRAIKYELEEKDMTVSVENDGDTLSAEKFDEIYKVHADGTVKGDGVLADALERKVGKIRNNETSDDEATDSATEPADDDEETAGTIDTAETEGQDGETYTVKNPDEAEESVDPEEHDETEGYVETEDDVDAEESNEESPSEAQASERDAAESAGTDDAEEGESLPEGSVGQFEAGIEAGRLQSAIDPVHAVVDECRIHLCDDGLVIRAVDPANVAMVDESVDADAFKSYETDCGVIGVSLEQFNEVIGIADDNETLVQSSLNNEVRKLEMQVGSVEYTLALIDPDAIRSEPEIPDLDLPAELSLDSGEFKRGIRAADMVSDHIQFEVDVRDEQFITSAEGDTDDVNLELDKDNLEDVEWGRAKSLFSLDYLKDLRKPIPKGTTLGMKLGEEFPLKLSFAMADEAIDVTYMLAPRIQSD